MAHDLNTISHRQTSIQSSTISESGLTRRIWIDITFLESSISNLTKRTNNNIRNQIGDKQFTSFSTTCCESWGVDGVHSSKLTKENNFRIQPFFASICCHFTISSIILVFDFAPFEWLIVYFNLVFLFFSLILYKKFKSNKYK